MSWFPEEWFPEEWFGAGWFDVLNTAFGGGGPDESDAPKAAPSDRKRHRTEEDEFLEHEDREAWVQARIAHRARIYAQPVFTVPPVLPVVVEEIPQPPIAAQPIVVPQPRPFTPLAGLNRNEGLPEGEEVEMLLTAMMFMEEMAA